MSYFEYRVVPAPRQAPKAKGVKGTDARFAHGLEDALNGEGLAGWEFQCTETLSAEIRQGLFRKSMVETVTVMIYRRWVETVEMDESEQASAPTPQMEWPPTAPRPAAPPLDAPETDTEQAPPPRSRSASFSAQRSPEGALRPVPGAARD